MCMLKCLLLSRRMPTVWTGWSDHVMYRCRGQWHGVLHIGDDSYLQIITWPCWSEILFIWRETYKHSIYTSWWKKKEKVNVFKTAIPGWHFPLPAITQSNKPTVDNCTQRNVWSMIIVRVKKDDEVEQKTSFCFHLCCDTQQANCTSPELNMWHLVAWGLMDIQTHHKAEKMAF